MSRDKYHDALDEIISMNDKYRNALIEIETKIRNMREISRLSSRFTDEIEEIAKRALEGCSNDVDG